MQLRQLLVLPLALACQLVATTAVADEGFAGGQTWGLELGFGGGWAPDTAYTRRLQTFGYKPSDGGHYRMAFAVEKVLFRYFSLLLQTNLLDNQQWERPSGIGVNDRFVWSSWALDVHARAFLPIPGGRFRGYVQFGLGPTFTPSRLYTRTAEGPDQTEYKEHKVSYNLSGLLGAEVMVAKHFGFYLQGGYVFAPTLQNLLGDQLQGGGGLLIGGLTSHFGRHL